MNKLNKVFIYLSIIAIGVMINTSVFAQKQSEVNPFIGLWKSENGSIIKIDGNQGVLLETSSEQWKGFINKITIKDIHEKDHKWLANEWLITNEANIWVEAVWELSDNEIKRFLTVKGKVIETYFIRIDVVYFIDGSSAQGTIVEINREKVRILQQDGKIVERSTKEIQSFSADRSFKDIFRKGAELEISQQDKTPEKRDWRAGVGIRLSYPKISDNDFEFDDTVSLGIDFTHYVSRFFSGEFSVDYLKTGTSVSNFNIGDLTQIAVLLTGRFHLPLKDGKILPYIGFGVGYYNNDFDESPTGSNISVSIDNSLGLHAKVGSEFFITEHLALNLDVMYIWNEADVKLKVTGSPDDDGELDLNTLKAGLGVKYFF